ncbi:hypothetical protein BDP27DRAFT_1433904 [Rhodocollybia butyracea]|uniref:Uncharacterized protein n=1 Tax=Rhodocollybia butyracea TaxID=206335 RepID=A0A9P5P711_9AGAR|nr:hypothetical protein BDP27DRAFT_1433904 [Rhodocollybia butyracea]
MLITPHIPCFGLIFIAFCVSAVHAMPTPPIAPRSGNDNTVHPLARRKEKGPKFRITLFKRNWNEAEAELPSLTHGHKIVITKTIQEKLGFKHIDAQYTNDVCEDRAPVGPMFIFVVEALEAQKDDKCGALPCVGYHAVTQPGSTIASIYQLKQGATGIEGLPPKLTRTTGKAAPTEEAIVKDEFEGLLKKKLEDPKLALETWWKNLLEGVIKPLDIEWHKRDRSTKARYSRTQTKKVKEDPRLRDAAAARARRFRENLKKKAAARNGQGNVAEKTVTQLPLPQPVQKTGKDWWDVVV